MSESCRCDIIIQAGERWLVIPSRMSSQSIVRSLCFHPLIKVLPKTCDTDHRGERCCPEHQSRPSPMGKCRSSWGGLLCCMPSRVAWMRSLDLSHFWTTGTALPMYLSETFTMLTSIMSLSANAEDVMLMQIHTRHIAMIVKIDFVYRSVFISFPTLDYSICSTASVVWCINSCFPVVKLGRSTYGMSITPNHSKIKSPRKITTK